MKFLIFFFFQSEREKEMHRFVRESELRVENVTTKRIKHSIAIEDGQTARTEYEQILQTPSSTSAFKRDESMKMKILRKNRRSSRKNVSYDKSQFFRAATTNDVLTIEQMKLTSPMLINACDQFGWTALMMASYGGNLDVIKVLLRLGANMHIENNQKETALILAERAKHHDVVNFLKQTLEPICLSSDDDDDDDSTKIEIYVCNICQMEIAIADRKSHETSTLHRFNRTDSQSSVPRFGIPESNVGFQMLLQQGWNRDNGLGAEQNGIMYPIKTTLRKPRSGLGVRQCNKPKVTHFKPFDCDAIKSIASPPPSAAKLASTKTKRQIRNEQLRTQRKDRYLRKLLS